MLNASLYIIVCSARNRLFVSLRRLREPRYLIGALAGAAYLYFSVFARVWGARTGASRRGRRTLPLDMALPAFQTAGTGLAGLALLVMAAIGWFLPFESGLLEFSEAETQFLFPAPLVRRQLLIHRLMRSQLGLLFAAIVSAIVFPSTAIAGRVRFALAMWLLLVTAKVYFTGVTLARTRLVAPSARARWMAWTPVAILVAALAIVGTAIGRELLGPAPTSVSDGLTRLGRVTLVGWPPIALWPFVALARPLFAAWPGPYLIALAGSLAVLAATVAWVLRGDEAFQDAATEAAERRVARRTAERSPVPRAQATAGWTLAPAGPTEAVFFWKNAMQTLRATSGVTLVRYLAPLVILSAVISSLIMSANQARGGAAALCTLALAAAGFAVLLGPQIVRTDLRTDLGHLELLKTWPIKAGAVIRGEMLWPACLVTLVGWFGLACATIFSAAAFPQVPLAWRLSISTAAVLLAPALVVAQLAIHNVAAVLFPAWVPLGNQRSHGLDAMGQRLILFGGVVVSLVFFVLPGAAAGGVIMFAFRRFIGAAALVPAAAVCGVMVLLEVLMITEAIAPVYERMDLVSVERGER